MNRAGLPAVNTMELMQIFQREYQEDLASSFFWGVFLVVVECNETPCNEIKKTTGENATRQSGECPYFLVESRKFFWVLCCSLSFSLGLNSRKQSRISNLKSRIQIRLNDFTVKRINKIIRIYIQLCIKIKFYI